MDTHTDGVKSTSADLFFFFHAPKNHLNFYCIKQIDKICPCVCIVIDRVKNNNHATRLRLVLFCLHAVTSSVIYYNVHTWKNIIYLLTNVSSVGPSAGPWTLTLETLDFTTVSVSAVHQPFYLSMCIHDLPICN